MRADDHAREVTEAVERGGRRVLGITMLSAPEPRKRGRSAWRVETVDGETCKARRLESADAARQLVALRAGLEQAFTRTLGCHGPVLLEEWVEGLPLRDGEAEAQAAEAGALLGRLHARTFEPVATARWRSQAERDLVTLDDARALSRDEIGALRAELGRHDPGRARSSLIHRDFCAENMLLDAEGRLRVIDNEWFEIDAAGLDLGRTLHRWPMAAEVRASFLAAYRSAAGADPGPLGFWMLVAVLWSARARLGQSAGRLAVPLDAARRLARGQDAGP